jgi:hypothetical protein
MKPSQNSWFKANTSVRSIAESGILGLVQAKFPFKRSTDLPTHIEVGDPRTGRTY